MSEQATHWTHAAPSYEKDFVDPYRPDVHNPLVEALDQLTGCRHKTAADLGCGIGPLLPLLATRFHKVFAVDFAEGMLLRACERCRAYSNLEFMQRCLTDLKPLAGAVDVAIAVNSLVLPDVPALETALGQVREALRPGGRFFGIVPAMDAVHYHTMLLLDRALGRGMPVDAARQNAAQLGEHALYDFAFGQHQVQGLQQHFWQPFEVRYRLRRAGFRRVHLTKVELSWEQFTCGQELRDEPPPWDWFFEAEPGD